MSETASESEEHTFEISLSEADYEQLQEYADRREMSEATVLSDIVSDHLLLIEQGWVGVIEHSEPKEFAGGRIVYQGDIVRRSMQAIASLYITLTVGVAALLLAGVGNLSPIELAATFGYLLVSLLVLLVLSLALGTQLPELIEQQYVQPKVYNET